MESPLDMLSRAASMVETRGRHDVRGDPPSYQEASMDGHVMHTKDLPTRSLKRDRLRERQELSQPMSSHRRDHVVRYPDDFSTDRLTPEGDKKDSTLPSYMSHSERLRIKMDNYCENKQTSYKNGHTLGGGRSPPGYDYYLSNNSNSDTPLNLSMTNMTSSSLSSTISSSSMLPTVQSLSVSRPSVITCVVTPERQRSGVPNRPFSPQGQVQQNSDIYPDIEEHFRRSLGSKYQSTLQSVTNQQLSPPATPPGDLYTLTSKAEKQAISVTGKVEDHFAKSLGNAWMALQTKNSNSCNPSVSAVDDHFAKALGGDTWSKIKAETEKQLPALNNVPS